MIRVAALMRLLESLPPHAEVVAYEGEDIGLSIEADNRSWWISARPTDESDWKAEGFHSEVVLDAMGADTLLDVKKDKEAV